MTTQPLPPVEFLRECFRYVPETGEVFWRKRPESHFDSPKTCANWNAKLAGTRAFTSISGGYHRSEVLFEGRRHRIGANRVIWKMATGDEPEMVDHRDLNTLNDRLDNLRASDRFSNRQNAPGRCTHPYPKGVIVVGRKFYAKGFHKGKNYHLGIYDTPLEAHEAYCAWARPLHGEFFNAGPNKLGVFG